MALFLSQNDPTIKYNMTKEEIIKQLQQDPVWKNSNIIWEFIDQITFKDDVVYIKYQNTGNQIWFKNGLCHRDDGPAIIWSIPSSQEGRKEWYQFGKLHREDGPAVEDPLNNINFYYLDGKFIEAECFKQKLQDYLKSEVEKIKFLTLSSDYFERVKGGFKITNRFKTNYYINNQGQLHRIDGPALVPSKLDSVVKNGYFLNGKEYSEIEYWTAVTTKFEEQYEKLIPKEEVEQIEHELSNLDISDIINDILDNMQKRKTQESISEIHQALNIISITQFKKLFTQAISSISQLQILTQSPILLNGLLYLVVEKYSSSLPPNLAKQFRIELLAELQQKLLQSTLEIITSSIPQEEIIQVKEINLQENNVARI